MRGNRLGLCGKILRQKALEIVFSLELSFGESSAKNLPMLSRNVFLRVKNPLGLCNYMQICNIKVCTNNIVCADPLFYRSNSVGTGAYENPQNSQARFGEPLPRRPINNRYAFLHLTRKNEQLLGRGGACSSRLLHKVTVYLHGRTKALPYRCFLFP